MKIIVDTIEEKDEIVKMSKYLHNLRCIDIDQCEILNTLCHLYTCDDRELRQILVILEK